MAEIVDVELNGSKDRPTITEIDAEEIARIIMRNAHARERPAIAAANAVIDYLVSVFSSSGRVQ